jgi:formamidopyrimidine-DNA glycosylase
MRKFATVRVLDKKELTEVKEFSLLGPEPLEKSFSIEILKKQLLRKPNGKIKQVLMNQNVISGIGNIYSDEILWASSISPLRLVKTLSQKDLKTLFKNTKIILKRGIDFRGDSMSDYRQIDGSRGAFQNQHHAYRLTGKKCSKPGCGGIIKRAVIGGRSAHFCSVHQK